MDKLLAKMDIKGLDEKKGDGYIGYASVAVLDRDKEIIDPQGWDLKNYRENPIILLSHDHSRLPIGRAMWVKPDDKGLKIKFTLANTETGKEVKQLIDDQILSAFSVGFIGLKWIDNPGESKDYAHLKDSGVRRIYTACELLEVSLVSVPCCPSALIERAKSGEIKTKELAEEILKCEVIIEKEEVVEEEIEKEGVIDTTQEEIKIEETIVEEKDGRVLSKKNRALIQDCVAKLMDSISALDTLLKATEEVLEENQLTDTVTKDKDTVEIKKEDMEVMLKELLAKKEDKDTLTVDDIEDIRKYFNDKHQERMTEQEMKRKGKVFV